MKIALLAVAALVPTLAFAESPKPYVVVNGHGAGPSAAPAPAPSAGTSGAAAGPYLTAATQASAFGANTVHPMSTVGDPAAAAAAAAMAASGSGRGFRGVSRFTGKRGVTRAAVRRAQDSPPPNYSKPGALIRTEGQLPIYTDPGNAGAHSVEGGSFVDIDPRRAKDVGRAPGIAWGAPDTPPSANPTGAAGGNGVTANGPPITVNVDNSHSNNTNGNQNGGSGNGNGNGDGKGNGNGNSISGFDPAF